MSKASYLKDFLSGVVDTGKSALIRSVGKKPKSLYDNCRTLLRIKGEASAIYLAKEVLDAYAELNEEGKLAFFEFLLIEYLPDNESIQSAITQYQEDPSASALMRLSKSVESPRQDLIRALNLAPEGTRALIDMRRDLLSLLVKHKELKPVEADFFQLLRAWFSKGFLRLREVSWKTPAFILEKLIDYESVHEIQGWPDLRRRMASDRRCFAFFHPSLLHEPIIFLEVALVNGLSESITGVLDADPPSQQMTTPDTAIFYSINNCQRGLKGISFGNFLIKQVTDELAAEFPTIKTFSTLSPIPGFSDWLASNATVPSKFRETNTISMAADTLISNAEQNEELVALCAYYLFAEKQPGTVFPYDPVARFHLRNGAQIERINWSADGSVNGLRQSLGMMVNYVYDGKVVARNHEAFVNDGNVAASNAIRQSAAKIGKRFE